MDEIISKIDELIGLLSKEIVDETVEVAKEALWDDGKYSGPGESLSIYHKGYMVAVLRWYKAMRSDPEGRSWTSPPKCEYL